MCTNSHKQTQQFYSFTFKPPTQCLLLHTFPSFSLLLLLTIHNNKPHRPNGLKICHTLSSRLCTNHLSNMCIQNWTKLGCGCRVPAPTTYCAYYMEARNLKAVALDDRLDNSPMAPHEEANSEGKKCTTSKNTETSAESDADSALTVTDPIGENLRRCRKISAMEEKEALFRMCMVCMRRVRGERDKARAAVGAALVLGKKEGPEVQERKPW
jgi:hypothetical protein